MEAVYIIIAGSLVAISCGLIGSYLILRKMAMVADAISHAVLPGIVIAFFISGSRESVPMLLGAGTLGIFTTFLIEFLHKKGKLQTDASIGVTFTWLFALGVILISAFAGKVDLDQDCVLYGEIAYVPIDLWITKAGVNMGPRVIYILGFVTALVVGFIVFGWKELFLTTFDPSYAAIIGINTTLWHYLLMGAVSLTTVASFEAVGAILVVALIIAPPATAYLITENFKRMLVYTCIIGVLIAVLGYYLARYLDGSIAGAMSTVAGIIFLAVFLFSPQTGLLFRRYRAKKSLSLENQPS